MKLNPPAVPAMMASTGWLRQSGADGDQGEENTPIEDEADEIRHQKPDELPMCGDMVQVPERP